MSTWKRWIAMILLGALTITTLCIPSYAEVNYYDGIRAKAEQEGLGECEFLLGGTNEAATLNNIGGYGYTKRTIVDVEGMEFTKAIRIVADKETENVWDVSYSTDIKQELKEGDRVWLRYFIRGVDNSSALSLTAIKQLPDYADIMGGAGTASADSEWVECSAVGTITKKSIPKDDQSRSFVDFQLGGRVQTVEIGGVSLVRLSADVEESVIDEFTGRFDYPGRDEDAAWRGQALEMIRENRMGTLKVLVTDEDGNSIENADVQVDMTRHKYVFGSCINASDVTPGTANDIKRSRILDMFNTVTFGNDLKWEAWDGAWGSGFSKEKAINSANYLLENGVDISGHVLLWPSWSNTPPFLKEYENDPVKLREEITKHIQDMTDTFRGIVKIWDVINEAFSNNAITRILDEDGFDEPYSLVDWFKIAKENDPNLRLVYNDYGMFGHDNQKHYEYMLNVSKFLKDNGAPIDMIGIQSYFTVGSMVGADEIWRRLDKCYDFTGLPVKFSEYNFKTGTRQDESIRKLQYDYTRDVITAVFAHPSTEGFIAWGNTGDGAKGEYAGFFDSKWDLTPIGQAFYDLVKGEWWTEEQGSTDGTGIYTADIYLGDHEITAVQGDKAGYAKVSAGEKETVVTVVLDKTVAEVEAIKNPPTPEPEATPTTKPAPEATQEPSDEPTPEASNANDVEAGVNYIWVIAGVLGALVLATVVLIRIWKKK